MNVIIASESVTGCCVHYNVTPVSHCDGCTRKNIANGSLRLIDGEFVIVVEN